MASDRQIEANRLNASKSTGPKTDEGKARSRANAWKHGMAAEGVGVDEAASPAFVARRESWGREYRPRTEAAAWALDRVVAESFRIERSEGGFDALVAEHADRAAVSWESDRRAEAATLAGRLARDPMVVSRRLETSRYGCEVMIETWDRLRSAAVENGEWSESESSTALDLLGLHPILRKGRTPLDPPDAGDRKSWLVGLADSEIGRLEASKAGGLDELDELARRRAERGIGVELTPDGLRLLRYQRDAWRRYRLALRDVGTPAAPTVEAPAPPATLAKPAPAAVAGRRPAPAAIQGVPPLSLDDLMGEPFTYRNGTESIAMIPARR